MEQSPFGAHLPWQRFWRSSSATPQQFLDESFLPCPNDLQCFGETKSDLELSEILPETGAVILCGEPGLGKSTEVEQLVQLLDSESDVIFTRARAHDSFTDFRDFLNSSPKWISWRDSSADSLTLLVDGIDEGMIRIPLFVLNLAEFLKNVPTERLRLILSCRSAEWPAHEGESLSALWIKRGMVIFELKHLRQKDARIAAEKCGHNGDDFIRAVYDAGVESLAARPITLLFLLQEFENGTFRTTSHRELYENGCRRFCEESNPSRITLERSKSTLPTSPVEKLRAAKILACHYLLGGKSTVHSPVGSIEQTPQSSLRITFFIENQFELSELNLVDSLRTGLFQSRGKNLFGFTHQTFAECLAGQELSKLPLVQLKTLLCSRDSRGEHVIPQLAELTSWVAGYHKAFFEYLISVDPSVLLRSDVSIVDVNLKSRLIEQILKLADSGEFFDESKFDRFWRGLNHPDLAGQIGKVLTDKTVSLMARRVAASIAEECRCIELIEVLHSVLDDHEEDGWLRESAAQALCKTMPHDRLRELEPMAKRQIGPDPNYSISGYAIKRLVPAHWTLADALPWIEMRPSNRHIGGYHMILEYHLPKYVTENDLIPGLRALQKWKTSFDSLGARRELSMAILLKSLERIDMPEIRTELVKLWRVKTRNFRDFFSDGRVGKNGLEKASRESRLKWAVAVLNDSKTDFENDIYHISGDDHKLIGPDDFGWLLSEFLKQPLDKLPVWSAVIQTLHWNKECLTKNWDLFIETLRVSPELQKGFFWFKPIEIESKEGRSMKAQWLVRERRFGNRQKRVKRCSHEKKISEILMEIANGSTYGFRDLVVFLHAAPGQTKYFLPLSRDILKYPGWENATEERREEIKEAARIYLINCSDGYAEIGGRTNYSDPGITAILLLREEIEGSKYLQEAVSRGWIDAITGDSGSRSDSETGRALFELAYRLNPVKTIQGWVRELRDDEEHLYGLRHAAACFDEKLSAVAVDFIEAIENPNGIESGIEILAELDLEAAQRLAEKLIRKFSQADNQANDKLMSAVIAGLCIACPAAWRISYPLLTNSNVMAKHVLAKVSCDLRSSSKVLAKVLTENELADLYLLLNHIFPIKEDPVTGTGFVTERQAIAQFRRDVLSFLSDRSTKDACDQLLRLVDELPSEKSWLLWRYQSTLNASRRKEWVPIGCGHLANIISDKSKRFVRDNDDLMDIVLESLASFQMYLSRDELPAVERLWQWDGGGLHRKNFRPKDEEFVSDEIDRWLRDQIGSASGVVVNREVQPKRGKKTDILVQAWSKAESGRQREDRPLSVTIEVKGCWNKESKTGAKGQLLEDYLIPHDRTHGIFLVAWFHSPKNAKIALGLKSSLQYEESAQAELELKLWSADAVAPTYRVEPFLLDVRLQ